MQYICQQEIPEPQGHFFFVVVVEVRPTQRKSKTLKVFLLLPSRHRPSHHHVRSPAHPRALDAGPPNALCRWLQSRRLSLSEIFYDLIENIARNSTCIRRRAGDDRRFKAAVVRYHRTACCLLSVWLTDWSRSPFGRPTDDCTSHDGDKQTRQRSPPRLMPPCSVVTFRRMWKKDLRFTGKWWTDRSATAQSLSGEWVSE